MLSRKRLMARKDTDERLERAFARLTAKRPIRSIQAVAEECGFTDLAEFNRLFYKRFGNSPVTVRRATRKGIRFEGRHNYGVDSTCR